MSGASDTPAIRLRAATTLLLRFVARRQLLDNALSSCSDDLHVIARDYDICTFRSLDMNQARDLRRR
jgi:hypothetical protein